MWLFDTFLKAKERLVFRPTFPRFADLPNLAPHLPNDFQYRLQNRSTFLVKLPLDHPIAFGSISDNHLPFLLQGVIHPPVAPFPQVWETNHNNSSALDIQTILEWSLISQVAVVQYLDLETFLNGY
ncbi:hypothetical protein PtA15_1A803 [Puccinia triticina]|uniref:Uncharacterized protein n=1 Tax=Puccinia triticina TaxID=208348 RepID=A0ABY7CF62_9BASI|nr:uncharacterized protein PtA15_1A803 [Puccinia triticina]WAQ81462.1 hypothetical protein PtA15_1A803 [Puccinia triticina]WAR52343.1 hypothetical protein PtB15_1B784 [Puccinia triticina]